MAVEGTSPSDWPMGTSVGAFSRLMIEAGGPSSPPVVPSGGQALGEASMESKPRRGILPQPSALVPAARLQP